MHETGEVVTNVTSGLTYSNASNNYEVMPKEQKKRASYRRAFHSAISKGDVTDACTKLKEAVTRGEPWAIKYLLDRTLGRILSTEELEAQIGRPCISFTFVKDTPPTIDASVTECK